MIVLVSDTSVLVDLERAALLEQSFSCGLTMVVPDLLYRRELADYNGSYLRALGLQVAQLTPTELKLVQSISGAQPKLSLPDCFALVCATRRGHALLSGDRALRGEAGRHGVDTFGLLWLLDQMELKGVPKTDLVAGLSQLLMHPRCRLPREDAQTRITRWS